MARTKLKDRQLPNYTKGEEIFNMVTHIVGGGIGVIATALCIIIGAIHKKHFRCYQRCDFRINYDSVIYHVEYLSRP